MLIIMYICINTMSKNENIISAYFKVFYDVLKAQHILMSHQRK